MAESAETRNTSPGEILRGARELYGWSLEEVAAELNLLPHVVEALEADDYSHIAGWTYAVGYLRNYARLAGVSIEQAITDRQELLPPKADGPGTMTETATSRPQPIPIQYRWVVTAGVLLLVVGGLYAAFLNRASDVERLRLDIAEETRSQSAAASGDEPVAATEESVADEPKPELAVTLTPTNEGGDSESRNGIASNASGQAESSELETIPTAKATGTGVIASVGSASESVPVTPSSEEQAAQSGQSEARSTDSAKNDQVKASAAKKERPEKSSKNQESEKKKSDSGRVATGSANTDSKKKTQKKSSASVSTKTVRSSSTKTAKKGDKQTGSQTQASAAAASQRQTLNPEVSTSLSQTSGITRPLTADSRSITLKVKESTHVVVWDRDNVELLRRYVEGGKVVSLAGKPPFTLLVSYPEGAKVVYGGREFRIPAGKSGRNAKVRVGL